MLKNICTLGFRLIKSREKNFTTVSVSHSSENTFEITEEHTNAGRLFHHSIEVILMESMKYHYESLQFLVGFSDGTYILVGNAEIPAFASLSQNLDRMTLSVRWTNYQEPVFFNLK